VTGMTRSELLPDVPTVNTIVPDFEASQWIGIGAPANTPVAIIKRLNGEANASVPTANPTLVTIACESADYRCDEGLVQLDLVRSGRPVAVTGGAASRDPSPATSAQCVAA
jgi:hypothetical protein